MNAYSNLTTVHLIPCQTVVINIEGIEEFIELLSLCTQGHVAAHPSYYSRGLDILVLLLRRSRGLLMALVSGSENALKT